MQKTIPLPTSVRDILGVTHVGGKYHLSSKDFLNEGADTLLELGTRVIKVWFTPRPGKEYPFNARWPAVDSLVGLAQTPYFRALFAKPFTTFLLETYAPGRDDHYFRRGMSDKDRAEEREKLRALTRHLLTTYKGSGKTFILQHWEGDWAVRGNYDPDSEPTPTEIRGMIDWLNARQEGVERARQDAGTDGVLVAHAPEVNLVVKAMAGKRTVTNDVLPHTRCDLVSYSAYDVPVDDPARFREALDYLARKAPPSRLFGEKNVYVGEFGAPENVVGGPERQRAVIRSATDTALAWGARYVVYWQLYCNEPRRAFEGRPVNDDLRGFWLVRPDGSRAPVWHELARRFRAFRATKQGGVQ